jgi:hypothetical protein
MYFHLTNQVSEAWLELPGEVAACDQVGRRSDRMWATCPGVADRAIAAVGQQAAAVSEDVDKEILGEIPQLDYDRPLRELLAARIDSHVDACVHIMQYRIDPAAVRAPTVAVAVALVPGTPPRVMTFGEVVRAAASATAGRPVVAS